MAAIACHAPLIPWGFAQESDCHRLIAVVFCQTITVLTPGGLGLPSIEGSDAAFPALGYWRGFVWGLLNIGRLSHSLMPPCLFRVGDHKCKYTVEHGNDSGTRGNIITL